MNFRDYGIMLPIAPDRGKQVLEFMNKHYYPGARGATFPYPGPVFSIDDALVFLGITGKSNVITREDLERVHEKEFIASLYDKGKNNRAIQQGPTTVTWSGEGFPLTTALLTAFELIDDQGRPNRYEPQRAVKPLSDLLSTILAQVGGTYLCCRLALAEGPGFCYYMGGGMHHARYDSGAGFCLVNDVTIALMKILSELHLHLVWIIDMDVHKGDGTAELIHFARERGELETPVYSAEPWNGEGREPLFATPPDAPPANKEKPSILTLSIHMAKGWPLDADSLAAAKKGRAPLIASDIDIGIDSGEEQEYTPRLAEGIKELERLSRALYPSKERPDLVLVVDGADPYEHDGLPSSSLIKLSLEQCQERDNYVYRYVTERGIPSAWIQSGGYGDRAWEPTGHFLLGTRYL
jgi:acetoin utilization deacetylase AcuC-like enzyme